ncbi:hypothetical protein N2603_38900 [Bradyrhizobium huanghuaihaiense]|uniref:hypothetical protein n=1 Tax=Bradyrhizobium huanghuaihaiense TaxID=990078 RepID=UPI0021AAA224|nr:hypothetical protein [Bradyrhizobium sp. CB3035]UWU81608.1 hypothetical protein N2603_38900 [Bradyrhizobium sp. CB3035]
MDFDTSAMDFDLSGTNFEPSFSRTSSAPNNRIPILRQVLSQVSTIVSRGLNLTNRARHGAEILRLTARMRSFYLVGFGARGSKTGYEIPGSQELSRTTGGIVNESVVRVAGTLPLWSPLGVGEAFAVSARSRFTRAFRIALNSRPEYDLQVRKACGYGTCTWIVAAT